MNAEYKRLESEAREIEREIQKLSETRILTATAHAQLEQKLSELHIRLRSLRHGMLLIRSVNSRAMRDAARRFVAALLGSFEEATGRRIVATTDGGRVRLRERRRGKTKKGRKRFAAKWREPRLFMIYAVDDEGRLAADFPPVIDGTLGSCDELFRMMLAYLQGLSIRSAERVLFVADGASWIWRRVPGLLKSLGLADEKVQQLIDFWHAVEYLGKIADSKALCGTVKKRWLTTQKKRLLRGEIGAVVRARR